MTVSLACLATALERDFVTQRPAFVAGHSLGEYSALVTAGSLTLEDGLRLVQTRANLMADAGEREAGTLAAILGLDEAAVVAICQEAGADVCNLNLPTQTVVGGRVAAVEKAMALARERGGRVAPLAVSGAFHSRLMSSAQAPLRASIDQTAISEPLLPLVANVTAALVNRPAAIADELETQVSRPVRWHESIAVMTAAGVSTFIEFGPGRVLTGMVRRLASDAKLINVSGLKDMGGTAAPAVVGS
jgi:[acyl-carrier-protein] S-malonyltransferase